MTTTRVPHTVIRMDIGNSSGDATTTHKLARQVHLDDQLARVIRVAMAEVPEQFESSSWYERVDGDSVYIVVPARVPRTWLASDFLRALEIAIRDANKFTSEAGRLRVRVAVTHGEVTVRPPNINGEPVVEAARLVDCDHLRRTMIAAKDSDLVLIVSERFFTDVIREGDRDLDPSRFDQVLVTHKTFSGLARIMRPRARHELDGLATVAPPEPRRFPSEHAVHAAATGADSTAAGRDAVVTFGPVPAGPATHDEPGVRPSGSNPSDIQPGTTTAEASGPRSVAAGNDAHVNR